jgi:hypothetical protein
MWYGKIAKPVDPSLYLGGACLAGSDATLISDACVVINGDRSASSSELIRLNGSISKDDNAAMHPPHVDY